MGGGQEGLGCTPFLLNCSSHVHFPSKSPRCRVLERHAGRADVGDMSPHLAVLAAPLGPIRRGGVIASGSPPMPGTPLGSPSVGFCLPCSPGAPEHGTPKTDVWDREVFVRMDRPASSFQRIPSLSRKERVCLFVIFIERIKTKGATQSQKCAPRGSDTIAAGLPQAHVLGFIPETA